MVYIVGAATGLKYINNEVTATKPRLKLVNWGRDGGGERSRGGVARNHHNLGDRMWQAQER